MLVKILSDGYSKITKKKKKQSRNTNLPDPGRHGVRARGAVMRVDDDDGDYDRGDDKDHGEEHVFPNERNGAGGGRDELHNNEQEDREGQQDGDGQSHLFTCGGG